MSGDGRTIQSGTWPARASAVLVLLQGLAILGYFWYLLRYIDLASAWMMGMLPLEAVDFLGAAFFFGIPAVLAVLTSIGLFLRRRLAWLIAMTAEGLLLASSLYFHFYLSASQFSQSWSIYVIMGSAIFMVFYLNSADVRLAFVSTPPFWRRSGEESLDHGV